MDPYAQRLFLPDAQATTELAQSIAPGLVTGDTLLLYGDLGTGKTHFARGVIQSLLSASGQSEDVPSPTFTLVQQYDAGGNEIWHCDLYRLSAPVEALELGLDEAFQHAICMIEWPDRLGDLAPADALCLQFSYPGSGEGRELQVSANSARWQALTGHLSAWK